MQRQTLAWLEDKHRACGLYDQNEVVHWMTPQVLRDNLGVYFLRDDKNRYNRD